MTYGIEIRNDKGGIQLNDTDAWLKLLDEGTVADSGAFYDSYIYDLTLPSSVSKEEPFLFCVQPKGTWIGPYKYLLDSDGKVTGYRFFSEVATTFKWKLYSRYDYGSISGASTWGAQIRDANGKLIFDSSAPLGKLVGVCSFSNSDSSATHPTQADAFYAINTFPASTSAVCYDSVNNYGGLITAGFYQSGDNSITIYKREQNYGCVEIGDQTYSSPMLLVSETSF